MLNKCYSRLFLRGVRRFLTRNNPQFVESFRIQSNPIFNHHWTIFYTLLCLENWRWLYQNGGCKRHRWPWTLLEPLCTCKLPVNKVVIWRSSFPMRTGWYLFHASVAVFLVFWGTLSAKWNGLGLAVFSAANQLCVLLCHQLMTLRPFVSTKWLVSTFSRTLMVTSSSFIVLVDFFSPMHGY